MMRSAAGIVRAYVLPAFLAVLFLASDVRGLETLQKANPGDPSLLDAESTLSDYLAHAALNNPGLKAAFNRWQAALERVPQMKALPDPRFTYSFYIREVETRVGSQRQAFSLSQTFPWFGTLGLQEEVARQSAEVERQRYESTRLRLFYTVKKAYFDYYYLARSISITNENVDLITYFEGVARKRYEAGDTPYAAVIRAQVELGKLEDRLLSQHDLRSPVAAELNAALNRPFDAPLPWPENIEEVVLPLQIEEIFVQLVENNPELKAIDSRTEQEKAFMGLAGKDFYPDITLGVTFIDTDEALMPGTIDSGRDPVISMLSLNLPIRYGKLRAARREATARHKAATQERRDKENTLIAGLKMAIYDFHDAERKIDLYRDTLIPKAEQSLNVTRQAFTAGTADFLDLIDTQRTLLEFELSYERALADHGRRAAEIEMLVGREIPRTRE